MAKTDQANSVTLVGLGNIGFRHLQGMGRIKDRIALTGLDAAHEALERSRTEWASLGGTGVFSGDVDTLGPSEIVVLATSSRGRLDLVRGVGEVVNPRVMVLEKVVFTTHADFEACAAWGRRHDVAFFVNCPRRLWPVFAALRRHLDDLGGPIAMEVTDPDLGLACNGVHIVDAFQYLIGDRPISLAASDLGRIVESKREGYREVFGRIVVVSNRGDRLTLSVREGDDKGHHIRISTGAGVIDVDQATGSFTGLDPARATGRPPYQSELTGAVVADLLDTGTCGLPGLSASAAAHGVIIDVLRPHFESQGIDCAHGLPIT